MFRKNGENSSTPVDNAMELACYGGKERRRDVKFARKRMREKNENFQRKKM